MTKTKIITQEKAAERFKAKLLPDNYGHKIDILWTGTDYEYSTPHRPMFLLKCSECGKLPSWPGHTNADGAIGASTISTANSHLIISKPAEVVDKEGYLILSVQMKRGDDIELWVAHASDRDFFEAIGKVGVGVGYRAYSQWWTFHKNSRGKWQTVGSYSTESEAIGAATAFEVSYTHKGYPTTVHVKDSDIGVTPVTATVKLSVKTLINEYKTKLRSGATPMEVKPWLDKADEAITQIEILEQFRAEVQERFQKSLEL